MTISPPPFANNDPHWAVRRAVVEAIGALKDPQHLPLLSSLLTDPDWGIRHNAVEATQCSTYSPALTFAS
jgi:HEAT repeat protein